MADNTADIIVIGGGVMGCAAAYHLAKNSQRVLLLERFTIGHPYGSSHGASRLFRLVHAELDYVQLARAAYSAWRELEAESQTQLLLQTDGLDLGSADVLEVFKRTMQAAGVWFEQLNHDEIIRRYPQFNMPEDIVGLYQKDYGLLAADRCVATMAALARQHGARIIEGQRVQSLQATSGGVQVSTDEAIYSADRLILSAGSWMRPLAHQLDIDLPLTVTKEMIAYYRPDNPAAFMPDRFPIFRQHLTGMTARWGVGFPNFNQAGVKATLDCTGPVIEPDDLDRSVEAKQRDVLRAYVAGILPSLGNNLISAETCRYTMTPDDDFILDLHPAHRQIVIASPCSGHGFKFAALIGLILADLAVNGTSTYDIQRFRLNRPALNHPNS